MIELFVAVVNRAAKDLGEDSSTVRTDALKYFLGEQSTFVITSKAYAVDYQWIQEKVREIAKEDGFRRKKLVENLTKKIREYV